LENGMKIIGGVRFVGATLWTDYQFFAGDDPDQIRHAMALAKRGMTDHHNILVDENDTLLWSPTMARRTHLASRAYIEGILATPFEGRTVVVTHHAPAPGSVADEYQHDSLTPAFASDLTAAIEGGRPDLWIHGHVHNNADYTVGDTVVICNPRGYVGENFEWNPSLVIDTDDLDSRPKPRGRWHR
jgi:hypothetical protein